MRPGGGKEKGSNFERAICEKLSLWISSGSRKDLLCRTVSSGGQFTTAAQKGTIAGVAGDLRAQDPMAFPFFDKFVVECKHWADLEMLNFLHKKGELYKALLKVQDEARKLNKHWILIARQNNRPALAFLPCNYDMTEMMVGLKERPDYHFLFCNTLMFKLDDFLSFDPEMIVGKYK